MKVERFKTVLHYITTEGVAYNPPVAKLPKSIPVDDELPAPVLVKSTPERKLRVRSDYLEVEEDMPVKKTAPKMSKQKLADA